VRGQRLQSDLFHDLVATASNDQNRDQQIGHTLFNLLIPVELEAYLAGSGEMQIELDAGTARVPWELLDTNSEGDPDQEPWAIRVKLLRKLRTARFREHVTDAEADASALVIGEPECPKEYPRLYGARREAEAVCTCLTQTGALDKAMVKALISAEMSQVGANARTVVNALFEKPWRIVHIAGHGVAGVKDQPGGVVLSSGSYLGPDEIRNMRQVPELVFVNCCHLASGDADQLLNYDRASFASGVAGALIEIGVRCVVAAGWAVDDEAASVFHRRRRRRA
jgi:CHAT domain-containing protein